MFVPVRGPAAGVEFPARAASANRAAHLLTMHTLSSSQPAGEAGGVPEGRRRRG